MRCAGILSACLGLSLVLAARTAIARCDPTTDPDKSDIGNARAAVAANCECAGAASHGAYVSCAAQQIDATLVNHRCRGRAKKCAAQSACGKPGKGTCCRTKNGKSKCTVTTGASCTKRGGAFGSCASCCDACPLPGSGPSCASIQCCLPTGTCTFDCQLVDLAACNAAGGFPQGPGTCGPGACDHTTTSTPPFACCLPDDQCIFADRCECDAAGGRYMFFQVCRPDTCVTTSSTTTSSTTTSTLP
jgi:hypothetical protein